MKEKIPLLTNKYEMVAIIDAALEDEAIDREVEWIKGYLADHGGELETLDLWGRRRLAYDIKKRSEGYYSVFRFTIGRETIRGLERELGLREPVLRFLAVTRTQAADRAYEVAAEEAERKAEQARLRQDELDAEAAAAAEESVSTEPSKPADTAPAESPAVERERNEAAPPAEPEAPTQEAADESEQADPAPAAEKAS